MKLQALLFDCDGVLAETERDGHRVAYNRAMREMGIDAVWSEEEYGELVLVSGGKERLKYYFNKYASRFPSDKYNSDLIQDIYLKKTGIFKSMANSDSLPPGRESPGYFVKLMKTAYSSLFVPLLTRKA
jgi:phosphoglycolate phosphatase-like HAD superfamily hydrolase